MPELTEAEVKRVVLDSLIAQGTVRALLVHLEHEAGKVDGAPWAFTQLDGTPWSFVVVNGPIHLRVGPAVVLYADRTLAWHVGLMPRVSRGHGVATFANTDHVIYVCHPDLTHHVAALVRACQVKP